MATKAKAKIDDSKIATNSKGFRKTYDAGVVGWQVFLTGMRYFVNVNQYASAISAKKTLIDYTLKGMVDQRKFLAENKIKIPGRLASRLLMAEKSNHASYNESTADYAKGLRKLVDLYDLSDKTGKLLIKSACQIAVKADKVKATNRLRKRIADMG
jgi:hypothetical protein